jgi:hypothetical protein
VAVRRLERLVQNPNRFARRKGAERGLAISRRTSDGSLRREHAVVGICSGTYLKREGRTIPLPAAVLRHCPDRFAYTDSVTIFADAQGLPRSVDLFSSKALFLKSHTDWDKELGFGDRYMEWNKTTAPKIQDGVLVFHYAVLESTNVLGRNFPTKFEFFQTGRQYEQDGNWFCSGIGRVRSVRPSTEPPALK